MMPVMAELLVKLRSLSTVPDCAAVVYVGLGVDRDDGGLVDDNALAMRVHQGIRRAQVDGEVIGEETEQRAHVVDARVPHLVTVG